MSSSQSTSSEEPRKKGSRSTGKRKDDNDYDTDSGSEDGDEELPALTSGDRSTNKRKASPSVSSKTKRRVAASNNDQASGMSSSHRDASSHRREQEQQALNLLLGRHAAALSGSASLQASSRNANSPLNSNSFPRLASSLSETAGLNQAQQQLLLQQYSNPTTAMLQGYSTMREPSSLLHSGNNTGVSLGGESILLSHSLPPAITAGSAVTASALLTEQHRRNQQAEYLLLLAQLGSRAPTNNYLLGNTGASSSSWGLSLEQQQMLLLRQQETSGASFGHRSMPNTNNISARDMTTLQQLMNSSRGQEEAALQQQRQQATLDSLLGGRNALSDTPASSATPDVASLLLHMRANESASTHSAAAAAERQHPPQLSSSSSSGASKNNNTKGSRPCRSPTPPEKQQPLSFGPIVNQPPCFKGPVPHWSTRPTFPLGIDEDPNWLSEFHCFVRSDIVELFRAGQEDVKLRNCSIALDQIGMRCRFCAHVSPATGRAGRASAVPSSLRQIYQSFTMMLRDHFGGCEEMPSHVLKRFIELKDKPAQGASDSKRYWISSAMKLGLSDSKMGIKFSTLSGAEGEAAGHFSTKDKWKDDIYSSISLVLPSDRPCVSEFLYVLISQVQPIRLMESECIGNRRSLRVGLPGFGCRFCCERQRLGLCRVFPARRRTLPVKMVDMFDHLRRCTLCPADVKEQLQRLQRQEQQNHAGGGEGFLQNIDHGANRDFLDRVWSRLGHDSQSA